MPGKDKLQRPSAQTLVATNRDGLWRFTAFQNARIVKRHSLPWMLFGIATKVFRK